MTETEFHRINNPEILRIISDYQNHDPESLAFKLSGRKDGLSRAIVEQVACRQKAKQKIPGWLTDDILFDKTALEQASSEATSRYKATFDICKGHAAIDITGGLGVDAIAMSANFAVFHYVDQNPVMCLIASHNFERLHRPYIIVSNNDGLEELRKFPDYFFDLIYADPSRRIGGRRVISLRNSVPDIPGNLDLLKKKANHILLKLSPVMDLTDTIRLLPGISLIDVVSYEGECRELLVVLDSNRKKPANSVTIRATMLNGGGNVIHQLERSAVEHLHSETKPVGKYLYYPDPAFTKAEMLDDLCQSANISRIHASVIYLTSDVYLSSFPGKIYQMIRVLPSKTSGVVSYLKSNDILFANIITRGFPEKPDTVYKRLKLKQGGNDYLFFTRDCNDQYIMIHCVPV